MKKIMFICYIALIICNIANAYTFNLQNYTPAKGVKFYDYYTEEIPIKISGWGDPKVGFVDNSPIQISLLKYQYGKRKNKKEKPVGENIIMQGIHRLDDNDNSWIVGSFFGRTNGIKESIIKGNFGDGRLSLIESMRYDIDIFDPFLLEEGNLSMGVFKVDVESQKEGNRYNEYIAITPIDFSYIKERCVYNGKGPRRDAPPYKFIQTNYNNQTKQYIEYSFKNIQPYDSIMRISKEGFTKVPPLESEWEIYFKNGDKYIGEIKDIFFNDGIESTSSDFQYRPYEFNGTYYYSNGNILTGVLNGVILKGDLAGIGRANSYKNINIEYKDGYIIKDDWWDGKNKKEMIEIIENSKDLNDLRAKLSIYSEKENHKKILEQEKLKRYELQLNSYKEYVSKTYPSYRNDIINGQIEIGMTKEAVSYSLYFRLVNFFMAVNELGEALNSKTNTFNIENFTFDKYNLNTLYAVGSKTPYSETYIINGTGKFMELPYRTLEFVNGKLYSFSK